METVYKAAGIKYVVMTNIPFDPKEAVHWLTESGKFEDTVQQTYNVDQFKSALRIDPLLKGDWGTIKDCLAKTGLPQNLDGAPSRSGTTYSTITLLLLYYPTTTATTTLLLLLLLY